MMGDDFFENLLQKMTEDIEIAVGSVCKNCGHVIAWKGLVHCRELGCLCLHPKPNMEVDMTSKEVGQ